MASKKNISKSKKAGRSTVAKTTKSPKQNAHKNSMMCGCEDCWHKAAWLLVFGIALGICIGYALFSNELTK